MLTSAKRRITAGRFFASVRERARLTGASLEEALQSLLPSLSDRNLERLEKELIQRGFGDRVEKDEGMPIRFDDGAISYGAIS